MTTRIQKSTVPVEAEIRVCDVCKKDIEKAEHAYTCDMCGRDVHPPKKHDGCCRFDGDQEAIVCSVCWRLGEEHRKVVARCEKQRDEAYAEWEDACNDHRYDDD